MQEIEERYISLLTDFGFKRIFGTAPNKELLINFLNSLFAGRKVIRDLKYSNSEHVGDVYAERKAIFDVYCESVDGEKFTPLELKEYEDSLKVYRDLKNSLDHAEEKGYVKGHEEGRAEGRAEGIVMTAKKLKSMDVETAVIQKATGLTAGEIEAL